MNRLSARVRDERGAVLLIFSILLVVLCIVVATVLDLGALRADASEGQSVADFAATAGAAELAPGGGSSVQEACRTAWGYFLANSPEAPMGQPDPCGTFQGMPTCTALSLPPTRSAIGIVGPFTVTISYPILDADPLMAGRVVQAIDGDACSRIGVTISRHRAYGFGAVTGASGQTTTMTAVARSGADTGAATQPVSLLLLDPAGCNALNASGQARVVIGSSGGYPGIIAIDSSGTELNAPPGQSARNCGANTYVIDAVGTQNSLIDAGSGFDDEGNTIPGAIYSFALMPGQGNTKAYEEADVFAGRLTPRPIGHERITRAPVDHRYNCKIQNACVRAATETAQIDALRAYVGTSGAPPGFREFPRDMLGGQCSMQPSTPAVLFLGDWWINCTNFSLANTATFTGGNVIFQGNVTVGSSGGIIMNPVPTTDRWVYFRNGSFTKNSQASINLDRTFVYLNNGRISFGAGSGITRWIAPLEGPFEDLTLWSESTLQHDLGGQASLELVGVFFTPNALPFRYTGQGGQNQADAQFIAYRMEVTGQGTLMMTVNPDRSVPIPLSGIGLIR
ncbi:MAG TPA: hypothetical protein VGB52_07410 [Actinomycetota bacterium]